MSGDTHSVNFVPVEHVPSAVYGVNLRKTLIVISFGSNSNTRNGRSRVPSVGTRISACTKAKMVLNTPPVVGADAGLTFKKPMRWL